jgi:hypothetical protein
MKDMLVISESGQRFTDSNTFATGPSACLAPSTRDCQGLFAKQFVCELRVKNRNLETWNHKNAKLLMKKRLFEFSLDFPLIADSFKELHYGL